MRSISSEPLAENRTFHMPGISRCGDSNRAFKPNSKRMRESLSSKTAQFAGKVLRMSASQELLERREASRTSTFDLSDSLHPESDAGRVRLALHTSRSPGTRKSQSRSKREWVTPPVRRLSTKRRTPSRRRLPLSSGGSFAFRLAGSENSRTCDTVPFCSVPVEFL